MGVLTAGRPAPARRETMLIGGEWVAAADGRTFLVENPAKPGTVVAEVPRGGAADVDRAVKAAAKAFPAWRDTHWKDRARALYQIAEAMDTNAEELARTLSSETGNALRTITRTEVKVGADTLRYFAGIASETKGETVPLGPSMLSYTLRHCQRDVRGVVRAQPPRRPLGDRVDRRLAQARASIAAATRGPAWIVVYGSVALCERSPIAAPSTRPRTARDSSAAIR